MNESDREPFETAYTMAYESSARGKLPSANATGFAFEVLRIYSLSEITAALTAHCRSPDAVYGLIPANVVAIIDGTTPTPDQIIAAAMKPTTPLAVLCRMEIGSWNLDNWDNYRLKPMAESCIAQLPVWIDRIKAGQLSAHETQMIEKYGCQAKTAKLTQSPAALQIANSS